MGIWALFLAVSTTFEMSKYALLKNGFVTLFHSTTSNEERGTVASSSLVLNVIFTAIFILLILIGSAWISAYWKAPALQKMLFCYIPVALCMIPFSHCEYLQQANMSFKGIFAAYFARQGLFFLLVMISSVWFVKLIDLDTLVIFQLAGIVAGSVISWYFSRLYLQGVFTPSIEWTKRLFKYGKYVLGSAISSNIFGSLDRFMTASFMSSSVVALYDVSARINNLMDVPTTAAADVLFPKSARASFEDNNNRVKYIYEKMVGILVALVLPASIVIFIFAEKIILIIAGQRYLAAASIIRIAMAYAFLRPIQIQASNVLNSINKPKITFYLNLAVLTLNILSSYLFIKYLGFMGAAYGTLVTTVFSFILSYYLLKNAIDITFSGILTQTWQSYKDIFIKVIKI